MLMAKKVSPYDQLHALSKTTALLTSIESLLEWDQETFMPADAIQGRALQIEWLASLVHKNRTSPAFAKRLGRLIDIKTGAIQDASLSPKEMASVREWRRDYLKAVKLPNAFVKQFAKTTATSSHAWKSAKRHNDFREFAPHLEKVVSLCRKKADILGFQEHPYDALLDLYEPDMKTSFLLPLFSKLRLELTALLKEITAKPPISQDCLHRHCPKHQQKAFTSLLLKAMGFHDGFSRIDFSAHPFCSRLLPEDVRMTTKIHPDNPFFSIFAVLHEGGHGLYSLGLPKEAFGSPLSEPLSLGIDESQSRWWETLIGQSRPFWEYFFPLLQREFPSQFEEVTLDDLYRAINHVTPSLIRIEADEVTYNLHIIVRFELEKALIEGSVKVREIPDLWNAKIRECLGVSPRFDGEGCLQDIHWSLGLFGYFPTYALGNLYAAQFFNTFEKQFADWNRRVAGGDLAFVREWLRENIHQYGRQFSSTELCQKATGQPLSPDHFMRYLRHKYGSLYCIQLS